MIRMPRNGEPLGRIGAIAVGVLAAVAMAAALLGLGSPPHAAVAAGLVVGAACAAAARRD
jgi:hypothetical protein